MLRKVALLFALLAASLYAVGQGIGGGGISNGCPVGSASVLGCYKVDGSTITATSGVISAVGGGAAVPASATVLASNSANQLIAATGGAYTLLANNTGSVGPYGPNTGVPCQIMPALTGDSQSVAGTCAITNTQASGSFNVGNVLSEVTLAPPSGAPFAPSEIDYSAVGTGGVVLVNSLGQSASLTNGTYTNISGTGGTGSGVAATIVVAANATSSVTITTAGTGYSQADALTFAVTGGNATAKVQTRNDPMQRWISSGATANYGTWGCYSSAAATPSRTFTCSTVTDTLASERQWFSITGTGSNFGTSGIFTALTWGNATDNPTYSFLGTGSFTVGGALTATGGITGVTSNTAASPGNYGELQYVNCQGPNSAQTITVTIASPAVVSWASAVQWAVSATNPVSWTCPIVFTNSGGALPTGITSGTTYYVVGASVSSLSFDLADTAAHALACTSSFGSCTGIVNTSGSQSGTQTGTMGAALTGTSSTWAAGAAMNLQAGDWDCTSLFQVLVTSLTTATSYSSAVNTSVGAPNGVNALNYTAIKTASSTIATGTENLPSSPVQELLSGTTTIYGEGFENFGGGSAAAGAFLRCRRMH